MELCARSRIKTKYIFLINHKITPTNSSYIHLYFHMLDFPKVRYSCADKVKKESEKVHLRKVVSKYRISLGSGR